VVVAVSRALVTRTCARAHTTLMGGHLQDEVVTVHGTALSLSSASCSFSFAPTYPHSSPIPPPLPSPLPLKTPSDSLAVVYLTPNPTSRLPPVSTSNTSSLLTRTGGGNTHQRLSAHNVCLPALILGFRILVLGFRILVVGLRVSARSRTGNADVTGRWEALRDGGLHITGPNPPPPSSSTDPHSSPLPTFSPFSPPKSSRTRTIPGHHLTAGNAPIKAEDGAVSTDLSAALFAWRRL
jgi:hypothetical protein